jgi:hypothetical protein
MLSSVFIIKDVEFGVYNEGVLYNEGGKWSGHYALLHTCV